jgi:anti-anti-sigma factor
MQNISTLHHQIIGDFTSQKAMEVKNSLSNLIEKGNANLSIDCTNVSDVDVVGINALAVIYKQLRSKKGILTILLNKDSHLSKMLHLTKFNKIFTLTYK